MGKYILEICVDSAESAIMAQDGGADRVELCTGLPLGGLTPSYGLFMEVKKSLNIPIHVLVRPRFGDFCYTDVEYSVVKEDIKRFLKLGAHGIVSGFLLPDGRLNEKRMKETVDEVHSAGRSFTLHRAFDMSLSPEAVFEVCEKLGVDTVLTSGAKDSCIKGIDLIDRLQKRKSISVMAGAGINIDVVREFLNSTDVTCFHMSAKKILESKMIFRNSDVSMGLPGMSEYEIYRTSEETVREVRNFFDKLEKEQ